MFSKYDTYLEIFVNNLIYILRQRNLSNTEFIKYCGISVGFFYRILKYENAGFIYYVKISEALKVPLYLLFFDKRLFSDKEIRMCGIVHKTFSLEQAFTEIAINHNNRAKTEKTEVVDKKIVEDSCNLYLDYLTEYVKNLLINKGVNKSDLAQGLGSSVAYINMVLNRKQIPSIGILIDIANYLNVPLFDLLNAPEKFQLGVPENYKRCLFRVTSII